MLFRKNTLKSNISGKLTAVFGTVAISMLLCTGTAAHVAVTSTTAVQSKSSYQNSIEINADEFSQVLQDYWNEAIKEASWDSAKTTTATQSKSKYQSSVTTATATQDKLKYKKYNENFDPMKRQKSITDLLNSKGVTPENTIDNSYIVYPSVADKYTCDTPYWINKAHELIDDHTNEYSATACALVLHDWMTSNLTYDSFKINHRNGYQRYYKTKYEADPSQYMSENKTGVCLDYAIVYTIMCREFNIPCVVLSNNSHAWNAIYINGEWIEVDITANINRYACSGFMTYAVNDALPDTATRFCFQ